MQIMESVHTNNEIKTADWRFFDFIYKMNLIVGKSLFFSLVRIFDV